MTDRDRSANLQCGLKGKPRTWKYLLLPSPSIRIDTCMKNKASGDELCDCALAGERASNVLLGKYLNSTRAVITRRTLAQQ
jgi:hypothetical protein